MKGVPARRGRRLPLWVWVASAVVVAHGLGFWAEARWKFLPRPFAGPPRPAPAPGFSAREEPALDPRTREVGVRREFTVPTRLGAPTTEPGGGH